MHKDVETKGTVNARLKDEVGQEQISKNQV